jgi:hypothetical protein
MSANWENGHDFHLKTERDGYGGERIAVRCAFCRKERENCSMPYEEDCEVRVFNRVLAKEGKNISEIEDY